MEELNNADLKLLHLDKTEFAKPSKDIGDYEDQSCSIIDSSDSETSEQVLQDVEETSKTENNIPKKSKVKYETAFKRFLIWKKKNNAVITEKCLIKYFDEYMKEYKPSTAWAQYSMIKAMLKATENVDISKFHTLRTILRKNASGFKSKKSELFTGDQIKKFLYEAPDEIHLAKKVLMIFGISGGCQGEEMTRIHVQDVKEQGELTMVTVRQSKTKMQRKFVIDSELSKIVKKYSMLRPENISSSRYFLSYRDGKCANHPLGKTPISLTPRDIAKWLNLENSSSYTGHALRRLSGNLWPTVESNIIDFRQLEK